MSSKKKEVEKWREKNNLDKSIENASHFGVDFIAFYRFTFQTSIEVNLA